MSEELSYIKDRSWVKSFLILKIEDEQRALSYKRKKMSEELYFIKDRRWAMSFLILKIEDERRALLYNR